MTRRNKILLEILAVALLGILVLMSLGLYLWQQSVRAEEQRLEALSYQLGQEAETAIIDARDLLTSLNNSTLTPCSPAHLALMQESAIARPYVRAIGYWRATDRLCGAGFIQGVEFMPQRASRIYDSGVIAWWPSVETEVGGVPLFVMRFGSHDVVIDPRLLIGTAALQQQKAGLWVEGLLMFATEEQIDLPAPETLALGLTVDNGRLLSRFSLGTVFPIDVVAQQPLDELWQRYMPLLLSAVSVVLVLLLLWGGIVLRYSRQRFSLATELRDAIAGNHIQIKYQPIINMHTGHCWGAESLARWTREGGEEVSPEVFIPMVEQAGLNTELATTMLQGILRDLGEFLRQHPKFVVNLNLAAHDLATDQVIHCLQQELKKAGIAPASIGLEITERALLDNDKARERIQFLRHRGHKISIDDFGTGYSSLSYLESFELDLLKVDKSFIKAIETHGVTSNVIIHIIDMAKSLQLDVIAEGVESDYQTQWLLKQNVELGQGHVFSYPLTAQHLIDFVSSLQKPKKSKIVDFHSPGLKSNSTN